MVFVPTQIFTISHIAYVHEAKIYFSMYFSAFFFFFCCKSKQTGCC